jgi:hypothetical protein
MSPSLQNELLRILKTKQLTPHFQPIISLAQRKIMGYEALIRGPSDSPLDSPFNLFETADRYASLNIREKLFINVSPAVLLEGSKFNGYRDGVIQDIVFETFSTC